VPDATFEDYQQLAGKVISVMAFGGTILPQPTWGQDAAFIGFVIDQLRAERVHLREGLRQIIEGDYPSDAGNAETWAREVLADHEAVNWNTDLSEHRQQGETHG
jgi:hypothetical protein